MGASSPVAGPKEDVKHVAHGIATAVGPDDGLTDVQATLLQAIAQALEDETIDYRDLDPLGPDELADVLRAHPEWDPHRIVHHMVLGELVLRPLPPRSRSAWRSTPRPSASTINSCGWRAATRRGRTGSPGWTSTAAGSWSTSEQMELSGLRSSVQLEDPLQHADVDPELAARWARVRGPAGRHTRQVGVGALRRPRLRAPWDGKRHVRVPRAARLRARAQQLRHQPQGRARGVRVHRARGPRPQGLRVARNTRRAVRDGLHRRRRLLREGREGAQHPSGRDESAFGRRHPAREGGVGGAGPRPVHRRLPRAGRPAGGRGV